MGWFKRLKEGITTTTTEKRETPEGLWYKCSACKKIHTAQEHNANKHVVLIVGITKELVVLNISKYYLTIISLQNYMKT